jgi:hypothetical protein
MTVQEALDSFPANSDLRVGINLAYKEHGEMANEMLERGDMPPVRALMAGLALDERARAIVEDALDQEGGYPDLPSQWGEVIIGSGIHAAIYSAIRVAMGHPKPLVLEKDERYGGTFAMTRRSSFFLNSRNRPGPSGAPGSRDALNVIPGAPMQPSDLGGAEYQANADLGLVVRCTLALNAVVRRAKVESLTMNGDQPLVVTDRGIVAPKRVIVATGLGTRRNVGTAEWDEKHSFSFEQFMKRFDRMSFPLRNLGRVAVVGGGDSGKTVVEALTGYGPYMAGSVASLDYIEKIDWYGKDMEGLTKERWIECNRTRYKPLAALFPSNNGTSRNARVRGLKKTQGTFTTFNEIRIGPEAYDTVIYCLSFFQSWKSSIGADEEIVADMITTRTTEDVNSVAFGLKNSTDTVFVVGPAAKLDWEQYADPEPRLNENKIALFRLGPRTAALAQALPAV